MKLDRWLAQTPAEAVASGQLMGAHLFRVGVHVLLGIVMITAAWVAHHFVMHRSSGAALSYFPLAIEVGLALFATGTAVRLLHAVSRRDEVHVIIQSVIGVVLAGVLTLVAVLDVLPIFVGN